MPQRRVYLVEVYASRTRNASIKAAAESASAAAAEISAPGHNVRHPRTLFLRDEETCSHLFEADTVAAVTRALCRPGIESERIVEADELC